MSSFWAFLLGFLLACFLAWVREQRRVPTLLDVRAARLIVEESLVRYWVPRGVAARLARWCPTSLLPASLPEAPTGTSTTLDVLTEYFDGVRLMFCGGCAGRLLVDAQGHIVSRRRCQCDDAPDLHL